MAKPKICSCGKTYIAYYAKKCQSCACRESKLGAKNPRWIGDLIKGVALHIWIRRYKPRFPCEECGAPAYDLANISGEYKRDINDYRWLCRRCHMQSDGRMNNLEKGRAVPHFRNTKGQYCRQEVLDGTLS